MPFDGTELPRVTKELINARNRIEKGWIQNYASTSKGVCMSFAIDGGYAMREECLVFLSAAIGGLPVVPWNDAPGRTKEEVLAAYDRAIELSFV